MAPGSWFFGNLSIIWAVGWWLAGIRACICWSSSLESLKRRMWGDLETWRVPSCFVDAHWVCVCYTEFEYRSTQIHRHIVPYIHIIISFWAKAIGTYAHVIICVGRYTKMSHAPFWDSWSVALNDRSGVFFLYSGAPRLIDHLWDVDASTI